MKTKHMMVFPLRLAFVAFVALLPKPIPNTC
jgi:hypothetical protein